MKEARKIVLFCLCIVLLASAPAFAFEKGTKGISGTLDFNRSKRNKESSTVNSLGVSPQLSYFVLKNVCVDLDFNYYTYWGENVTSYPSLGIGIGGQYFYKKFYGGVLFTFNWRRTMIAHIEQVGVDTYEFIYDGKEWEKRKEVKFRIGHLLGIGKNVYLDTGVFYRVGIGKRTFSQREDTYDNELDELGINFGIRVFL